MQLSEKYRLPVLVNKKDKQLLQQFTKLIGLENQPIMTIPIWSGSKGRYGICSINIEKYVENFGGEPVFVVTIEMTNDHILAAWHVIWKYKEEYFEVTEPEKGC